MMVTNPFFHRGPIRDIAYFFGRQQETTQMLDLLRNGQSVSLVAPRRMGKTSLLFHLANPQVFSTHDLTPDRYCFVYLDCEGWSRLQPADFYLLLLDKMQEALTQVGHADLLPTLPTSPISYRTFERVIRTVVHQSIQLIFLWDEFEALSANPHLDTDFFSGLRGLATQYGLAYVTASTESLLTLTYANRNVLSSPFFNIFAQIRLRLFTLPEAVALLVELAARQGVSFTPETVTYLFDLAGCHPLYLQIVGYHAYERSAPHGRSLTQTDYPDLHHAFYDEVNPHWLYTWSKLAPEERKCLALLPRTRSVESTLIQRLENVGVIRRHGSTVVYLSSAFQVFVAQQATPGLWQAPPLTLEPVQRIALQRGQILKLSPSEFDLLAFLMQHEGQLLTADEMMTALWPGETHVDNGERLKDVLKSVRRLLGADAECIQNVRGQGYFFRRLA